MLKLLFSCLAVSAHARVSALANKITMDPGWTEYIVQQYTGQQKGNVVAVAATSDGTVITGKAPGASFSVNANTVFEVGSTTKTFAMLAMELLIEKGKLNVKDTLRMLLPSNVQLSAPVGAITMLELATHTSGLERMPTNIDQNDPDPMKNYDETKLYAYLSNLTSVGPKKFLYSNTGFGLIGWITCLVTGQGWEALVKDLILTPLALTDTAVALSSDQTARLAPSYADGQPAPPTSFMDAMVGAGGLRSTATDMLKYVSAFAGLTHVDPSMRRVMDRMMVAYAPDEFVAQRGMVDLAYQTYTLRSNPVVWKDGATSGYNCYIALTVSPPQAAILLANTAAVSVQTSSSMAANMILAGPPQKYPPVQVPPSVTLGYQGDFAQPNPKGQTIYQARTSTPNTMTISSLADPRTDVMAFTQQSFYATSAYLETTFDKVNPSTLTLFYSGQDHFAVRVDSSSNSSVVSSSAQVSHRQGLVGLAVAIDEVAFANTLCERSLRAVC